MAASPLSDGGRKGHLASEFASNFYLMCEFSTAALEEQESTFELEQTRKVA